MTVPVVHLSGEEGTDALRGLVADLQRYAGWLAKDHASIAVRADIQALTAAVDTGTDASMWLQVLDKDLGRLPSGGLRPMLRKAAREIRTLIEPAGLGEERRERP